VSGSIHRTVALLDASAQRRGDVRIPGDIISERPGDFVGSPQVTLNVADFCLPLLIQPEMLTL